MAYLLLRFLFTAAYASADICPFWQISAYRPNKLGKLAKRHKTVNRVYGGHLSHAIVKER